MKEVNESMVKENFGEKTFFKGLNYYNSGRVSDTVKVERTLYAQVLGSSAKPYEVRAFIQDGETSTRCTCPVGFMCKHGAALLLKWIHEPSSFMDADQFLLSLERMSKGEIIGIIGKLLKQDPSLINEFYIEKEEKPEINIDDISEKIEWIVHGELDYYHIHDAIQSLEEIKNIADRLREKGSYKNAAEIYLALVKGGMTAYEEGADDSDGDLGSFVYQCITDFNVGMEQVDDLSYKNELLERILDIVEEEDYGLETDEMLFGIVTDENIHRVEEYMLGKLEEKRKTSPGFSYEYKKEAALELLIELYGKLGKPQEKLRLARYELADKEDYTRLAKVLIEEKRFEEALDTIKKGLALPGEPYLWLNELYFNLAGTLIREEPGLIEFKTSLDAALPVLEGRFDREEYEAIKRIFQGIGRLDEFKSVILKSLENKDSAVRAFLYDGELKKAVEIIRSEPGIYPWLIIKISKLAKDQGMIEESSQLTRMTLEMGWGNESPPMDELLKVMVEASDMDALEDLCKRILKNKLQGTAVMLIPYLLGKAPELAVILAKNFINAMPVELVAKVAGAVAEKAPEESIALCRMRLNEGILRSHVHYDKAVLLLRAIRNAYVKERNEAGWSEFIRRFASENKSKKKLIEKLKKEFGAVL